MAKLPPNITIFLLLSWLSSKLPSETFVLWRTVAKKRCYIKIESCNLFSWPMYGFMSVQKAVIISHSSPRVGETLRQRIYPEIFSFKIIKHYLQIYSVVTWSFWLNQTQGYHEISLSCTSSAQGSTGLSCCIHQVGTPPHSLLCVYSIVQQTSFGTNSTTLQLSSRSISCKPAKDRVHLVHTRNIMKIGSECGMVNMHRAL